MQELPSGGFTSLNLSYVNAVIIEKKKAKGRQMVREYLRNLEKNYGYTGNWQPNSPIDVGNWSDVELGFLPWLKQFLGISYQNIEINKNLHSVMTGSLDGIAVQKEKRAPMTLSYKISMSMSESCHGVRITAQKKGGFYAAFQDMQEVSADPVSFRDKLDGLDKDSVAIVSGVTYVKKGILIVFAQEAASLTLSGNFSSLMELLDKQPVLNTDFQISCESEGIAAFQAEPGKPLIPFMKIYIAERDKQRGFCGRSARPGRNYDITPFSYDTFFDLYQDFGV